MDFENLLKKFNAKAFDDENVKKIGEVWKTFSENLMNDPELCKTVIDTIQKKQIEMMTALQQGEESKIKPAPSDRRFSDKEWQENPFFSVLMQNYLLNSDVFMDVVEKVNMPDEDKKILTFVMKQYLDTVSPTNFPGTNPSVVNEAINSGGESLVRGMKNLMQDIEQGSITNTDLNAFKVGDNIATTPGKVVYQNPLFQLIEYKSSTKQVYSTPLLIVPPCINKYYILDLTPEKSLVADLVNKGHRVFLMSWVNADSTLNKINFDDYLRDGVMNAISIVSNISRQDKINTLGFCIGGTLLICALSALAADGQHPAASVTLFASLLDFSDTGEIGLFIDEESTAQKEKKYAQGGLIDGRKLAQGFSYLRPNDLIWPYVINNYYKGKNPPAFDLLFWNSDSTNLPAPMFTQYLRQTYLENQISKKTAKMCGAKIIPSSILSDIYVVSCEKDHIVPWKTAYLSALLVNKKARFVLSASGHIAGIINPPEQKKGWYEIASDSLTASPDTWREKAKRFTGSWWDDWGKWLGKKGGKKITAPKSMGNVRYAPIQDAPGDYVTAARPAIPDSFIQ